MGARKIAAGNWKMNGLTTSLAELDRLAADNPTPKVEVLICPPATLIERARSRKGALLIGGQDAHCAKCGAHTGDVSAEMLADAGATHVILGHSERRTDHTEDDALISGKVDAALAEGLVVILCVGEQLVQREAGETLQVVAGQLADSLPADTDPAKLVVAYEPVWAIGTGKVPTLPEIAEVHADMRARLTDRFGAAAADIPLLYGGSVKAANAAEIFAVENVDGALVGGASLKAVDFQGIIDALEASAAP